MKPLVFVIFFLCVAIQFSFCQSAFQDAQILEQISKDTTVQEIDTSGHSVPKNYKIFTNYQEALTILSKYTDSAGTGMSFIDRDNLISILSTNPFLTSYFQVGTGQSPQNIFGSIVKTIGGLDVTAFADGLAKFLVERTKEELNEAFFRKFADFLKYYPEFKILFPNTDVLVDNFNSWEYANLLNTLREAFDKDVKELLANL